MHLLRCMYTLALRGEASSVLESSGFGEKRLRKLMILYK